MDSIPYGHCHCGCGGRTALAKKSDKAGPYIKGEPVRFLHGHRISKIKPVSDVKPKCCLCGCGQLTKISDRTNPKFGCVRGERRDYIKGHYGRNGRADLVIDCGYKTPCWIWRGGVTAQGYGRDEAQREDGEFLVHRISYKDRYGSIPKNHGIHHKCHQKRCRNADHLEALTQSDHARLHHKERRRAKQNAKIGNQGRAP